MTDFFNNLKNIVESVDGGVMIMLIIILHDHVYLFMKIL